MTILPTHFNSRPHGGRLSAAAVPRISSVFQLTPSRRATKFLKESKPFLFISTHALTEGDIHLRSFARKCRISTHALTEGDQNSTESGMHGEDFNSRPHGGRRFYLPSFPPLYDFNSRPHGGRHSTPHVLLKTSLFQLTPSRKATYFQRIVQPPEVFQLTPSRRATKKPDEHKNHYKTFQLTPSRRATGEETEGGKEA